MPRPDRLLAILQILRNGRLHRAQDLGQQLGVSTRTIWRDMDKLTAAGVPIQGARGAGYRMTDTISLPPLHLSKAELEALNLGLAVVAQAGDDSLREAAGILAEKIELALPTATAFDAEAWQTALTPFADATRNLAHMPLLRSAIRARQKVRITYTSQTGTVTSRVIRPLLMEHWGMVWALTAWCESLNDFNIFRLDLMESAEALPELFVDEPGKRIEDYAP